jgi:tetratricopeptide (TPR) repeat protein/transglutaminase-like putative cysteine protease
MFTLKLHGRRPLACLVVIAAGVWPSTGSARQGAPTRDYSREASVVEQMHAQYKFEQNGTGRRQMDVRVKVQSEAGVQQFGQLIFGYNAANERPEIAYVRVRKPDGSVVATPEDGVQDLSSPVQRVAPIYTDFRQKHVTVQGLRPGDTLEFSVVTLIHTALAPGQFWMEYDFSERSIVLDERLEIDVPLDRAVTVKTRPGFDPSIKEANGRRVYDWKHAQLEPVSEKRDADAAEKAPSLDEPQPAAVRLTTFQTWEQVGEWYAALESPQRVPTPEIRKKAAELIAGRATDVAKLEALYEFVATGFRYVSLSLGAGRYQPRAAGDVLREQYGDCKDKHTLLASLIDAAGLKASAVLINSAHELDPSFPSPSQFNHVITRASAGGQEVWLDTTTEVAAFRLIMFPLRNKQALLAESGAAKVVTTPADPPMTSFMRQVVEGTLGDGGKLEARVRMAFRGDTELVMRTVFRSTPASAWKELLEGIVKATGISGEVSDWKVSDPASLREPFELEFKIAATRFANWTSKRITVSLPLADDEMVADATESDTKPTKLGAAPSESSYKLQLRLPADVTVRAPVPVAISRDYADYRATYSVEGSTLSAERVVSIRKSELPIDRSQDYAAFVRVVRADAKQALALETSAPIAAAPVASNLSAAELNRQGYDALQAGNYAQAVALLKRVVELEPKDKIAWNNLGRAHSGLRELDAAIAAYRKQIEVNPYDAYAFNNLGRAYVAQQKFAEAEAAFLKQLEVNPLDEYVPSNLGALYLERRQYDKALPQFEKAITLTPNSAWLHVQLGKAQLNLKHESEAMAAFDKAIELSPTPTMWNDIGYELALSVTQLDRALRYAESAVSSATAASRNLDVARADASAFGVVRSLAAYWDTLGWVHFARGDLNRALPYVEASWRLAQHAEVGDHLGQIYEKLGRRDDAIRTYAQALTAERPSDRVRERLGRLAGPGENVDRLVENERESLSKSRTLTVSVGGGAKGHAEFVVLLASPSAVEAVRFISGDEALRPLGDALAKASVGRVFPDEVGAKIIRRGVLVCSSTTACSFTFMPTDDAKPVK